MTDHISQPGPRTYYGFVRENPASFAGEEFRPMNSHFGTLHQTPVPVVGPYGAELTLSAGEFFDVPRAGQFLHYADAYRAARGKGEYGGDAVILIRTPADKVITALDSDGSTVVVDKVREYAASNVRQRLVFPYRVAGAVE